MFAVPPASTIVAIAPAARQTKSAECALTTRAFLATGKPPRVDDGHHANVVVREPGREQPVRHQGQPVLDGRIRELAEIGREHVALRARRPDGLERRLPGDLARVDRGEAALEQRALAHEILLLADG